MRVRGGVVDADYRVQRREMLRQRERRRLPDIVGVCLERGPQQADAAAFEGLEAPEQQVDDARALTAVHRAHRAEQLCGPRLPASELLYGRDVLGKTGAAEAESSPQMAGADPRIEGQRAREGLPVGADRLADVRQSVGERHLRREEGVRRDLAELRAWGDR